MDYRDIVTAIDIGTTKIYVVVAYVNPDNSGYKVLGYGMTPSRGLKKGVVVDVEQATMDIEAAVKAAEHMSGIEVRKAYVGISGKHIESLISHSLIERKESETEISMVDVKHLEDIAKSKVVPVDRDVIHMIPFNYKVDERVMKNPMGEIGKVLEGDYNIITGVISSIDDIVTSVEALSIEVESVVLEPLASAKAIIRDDEKSRGIVLVDIGGGTTDIAIVKNGKMIYSSIIAVGGEHYTQDLSTILEMDYKISDRLKKEIPDLLKGSSYDEVIKVECKNSGDIKKVKLSKVKDIINSRTEELLDLIAIKIDGSGFGHVVESVVFTGGGSQIFGMHDRAVKYYSLPVRFGYPIQENGFMPNMDKPEDATGIGLLLYGVEKHKVRTEDEKEGKSEYYRNKPMEKEGRFEKFKKTIKNMFEVMF